MGYLTKELKTNLKKENEKTCNGILILVDIKNSTQRKIAYKTRWWVHVNAVFHAFYNLSINIATYLDLKEDKITIKFLGDGFMCFFPTSTSKSTKSDSTLNKKKATDIVDKLFSFIQEIHEETNLADLRLKSVITYCTEVYPLRIDSRNDVLGRGIDFSFRLEKFGDASHLIMNKMFKESLCSDSKIHTIGDVAFDILESKKKVRGWTKPDGEIFYILTSKRLIENGIDLYPSPYEDDVLPELFTYYLKNQTITTNNVQIKTKKWRKGFK